MWIDTHCHLDAPEFAADVGQVRARAAAAGVGHCVLPAVEAACAEALREGVHSADVILNILSRRRDAGPPATIMTPAAVRLRHEPAADCARYDSLRRAS